MSALVSCATAATFEEESGAERTIGIVAPYRAQVRLIRAILNDWGKRKKTRTSLTTQENENGAEPKIRCATAHQFQGGERDYIVYDATDCYVRIHCGKLLTEKEGNAANRLFNVAASRARGKFIVVGHAGFLKRKLTNDLIFKQFLTQTCEKREWAEQNERAFETLTANTVREGGEFFYGTAKIKKAESLYLKDLQNAKERVWIDWGTPLKPDADIETLLEVLQSLKKRGVNLYLYSNDPAALPSWLRDDVVERRNALNSLTVVDGKVVWVGAPFANNYFRSKAGKKLEDLTRLIAARIVGKKVAGVLKTLLNVDFKKKEREERRRSENLKIEGRRTFADYVAENVVCPKCGKTMRLRFKFGNGYFFGCSGYSTFSKCDGIKTADISTVGAYLGTTEKLACGDWVSDYEICSGKYGVYLRRLRDGKTVSLNEI